MNKQNIVIKIAKITRLTGEIKYYIDVNGFVDLDLFVPDIMYLDSWMEEIYAYVLTDKSQRLEKLITNIGFNDAIEKYIQNHRNEIKPSILEVLENYFFTSRELFTLCEENSIERKGKYINLIEPLAKAQIAELLDRAIGAGILDKYYQPVPGVKLLHLKIIAYAISFICKLKHPYALFEKQWRRKEALRISTCKIPKFRTEEYELTKSLYPEVDFSELEPQHKITVFYTNQDVDDIYDMYQDLIKYKYIAPNTAFDTFKGIVGKADFSEPVEWLKGQRQLGYFIYLAFNKHNSKDLWIKGECCFCIKGESPHRNSFLSGYSSIKRAGLIDKYDFRLKDICNKFNHIDSTETCINGRLIHTSKYVFYSSKSEEKKRKMFSDLLSGGYISPDTTYTIFSGIFEEIDFKQPVVWIKKQCSLIYFIYMVFKDENPYDLWAKCVYCFRLQSDKTINRRSLDGNRITLMKTDKPYNIELKRIAEEYNDNINSADTSMNIVADAHIINT